MSSRILPIVLGGTNMRNSGPRWWEMLGPRGREKIPDQ